MLGDANGLSPAREQHPAKLCSTEFHEDVHFCSYLGLYFHKDRLVWGFRFRELQATVLRLGRINRAFTQPMVETVQVLDG